MNKLLIIKRFPPSFSTIEVKSHFHDLVSQTRETYEGTDSDGSLASHFQINLTLKMMLNNLFIHYLKYLYLFTFILG
jgi:hypothetical protein